MSDEKKSPHSLAAFLRGPAPSRDAQPEAVAPAAPAAVVVADTDADTTPVHVDDDTISDGDEAWTAQAPAAQIPTPEQIVQPLSASLESAPSFMRAARTSTVQRRTPFWQWPVLAGLALLLAVQVLVADRARLSADASWRPVLASLCAALRCELPPWHEPAAFTMLNREVRPAADQRGVLQVQASFRNDARWAQAWPQLQLSLSDADGRVIGSRVFSPQEYLGLPTPPDGTLAPGQGTQITFRVHEPAASTAAFGFEFR
jgi:hypothetical protein